MKSSSKIIIAVVVLLLGGGLLYAGSQYFDQGSVDGPDVENPVDGDTGDTDAPARWSDTLVKAQVQVEDLAGDSVTSGTLHFYEEKPEEWDNQRTISNSFGDEAFTESISSQTTTIQEYPGDYYVVVEHSGAYHKFGQVSIPDGSEAQYQGMTIADYQTAPKTVRFTVSDYHTLDSPAYDLGVSQNSTDSREIEVSNTYTPVDDSEYRLWKAVVETGSADPTTDSDSDGVLDEGISSAYLEISGGVDQSSSDKTVFFNPNNGVDMLGAENKANINMDGLKFNGDNDMTVTVGVQAEETSTSGATDGDEILTDGEQVFTMTLFDDLANSNSNVGITG